MKGGIKKVTKQKSKQISLNLGLSSASHFVWDEDSQCNKIRSEGWGLSRRGYPLGPNGFVNVGNGGRIGYFPRFFGDPASWFGTLKDQVAWERRKIKIFGKEVMQPRLVAYMADNESLTYTYSRVTVEPLPYTPAVAQIKFKLEEFLKTSFNCVLLNYYENGKDHMGWHSDNEPLFGKEPIIGSVSFGEKRSFHFRNNDDPTIRWK